MDEIQLSIQGIQKFTDDNELLNIFTVLKRFSKNTLYNILISCNFNFTEIVFYGIYGIDPESYPVYNTTVEKEKFSKIIIQQLTKEQLLSVILFLSTLYSSFKSCLRHKINSKGAADLANLKRVFTQKNIDYPISIKQLKNYI